MVFIVQWQHIYRPDMLCFVIVPPVWEELQGLSQAAR